VDDPDLDLLTEASAAEYLRGRGVIGDGPASVEALGGGVSNIVLAVTTAQRRVVLKQALPRLRVAREWLAKRERALAEARALALAVALAPGSSPRVLDVDPDRCALTIEAAPADWLTWKERLFEGAADTATAARLGELLAGWHRGTSERDAGLDEWDSFEQLRIDPYYREAARRHPDLAETIIGYVDAMTAGRVCLVHGDFSPKNILLGDSGLWVIDFEVAHRGDPAFDVAFLLTHLSLKAIFLPELRSELFACAAAFDVAYREAAPPLVAPATEYVLGHVGCLMLARVDGKSPVEYLDDAAQVRTRAVARSLLAAPPGSLAELARAIGDSS
jgi:aminoglycoside phosphotransferase (APT) family kinase protein